MATIREQCMDVKDYVIEMRRKLHQIPELGIHNPQTRDLICAELDKMGVPYQSNTVVLDGVQDTSVVGFIQGKNTDKVIMLRADVDALPIEEQLDVPYKSQNEGRMHACGHDNHCAMLLGAAKVLSQLRDQLNGSVKLVFQSGEEVITGAKMVIQGGFMENPKVTACLGMHVWPLPQYLPGTVVVRPGCMMASGNKFDIHIKGEGSHGSQPALGKDPIACAGQVLSALQNITSRELPGDEPRVLSICQVHAGSAWNIIPAEAYMQGTIRTTSPETQAFYMKRITEVVEGVSAAMRCEGRVDWVDGTPPVMNDPAVTALATDAVREVLGQEFVQQDVQTSMGNEDFAYYQERSPGAFAFLNISSADPATHYSVHSPTFQVDESILWQGTAVHVQTAVNYLR